MTDKILTEAYDKLKAIEEGNYIEDVTEDSGEDVQDGLDELWSIQEEMYELIERLDSAIRAYVPDQHSHWQSYGLAQLKIIVGSDEYATSDESINNLIDNLKAKVRGGGRDDDDDADLYPGHPDAPSRR